MYGISGPLGEIGRITPAIIKNFASTALYCQGSNVQANNCVFANCGEYCAALYYGGDYRFLHCTFANIWNGSGNRQTRQEASVVAGLRGSKSEGSATSWKKGWMERLHVAGKA